eukprot:scaffold266092_cov17-Tisochrysis_lutea.AAC.1
MQAEPSCARRKGHGNTCRAHGGHCKHENIKSHAGPKGTAGQIACRAKSNMQGQKGHDACRASGGHESRRIDKSVLVRARHVTEVQSADSFQMCKRSKNLGMQSGQSDNAACGFASTATIWECSVWTCKRSNNLGCRGGRGKGCQTKQRCAECISS